MSHKKKLAGDEVKAEPRRTKGMQNSPPDPDQEAKARHQAHLDQRHLEAYRNMRRLRDILHRRYAALLKDKVQSQRSLLQQRHEMSTAKSGTDAKQKQKKLVFSKLQHNDSYLTSLPKSSYYLIFDLQKQLAARGQLKTHYDLEDFYRCIKYNDRKSQLEKSLQDVRQKMLENTSAADLSPQHETTEKHPCTAEEGRRRNHIWNARLLEQVSSSGDVSAKLIFSENRETEEFERMFPKMKVPTFATLQPEFGRNLQSTAPDLVVPEIPRQSRKAEIYLRRLRQMHNLCLTNMAFTQRLLDAELDSLRWQEDRGVQDLVSNTNQPQHNTTPQISMEANTKLLHTVFSVTQKVLPGIHAIQVKRSQSNQPPLSSPQLPKSVQTDRPTFPQQMSRMSSASRQHLETCSRKTPDPLSIEDVCQQEHVVVIDHVCKLWRNYTHNTDN